ncbi:M28 family peptidase [Saccharopolyspora sp. 5N708]|uniref:M28 family peptidase n=1 Tax=Saccharopolyspora sp. 5N708 TaxID=3457424 RepID=UPI003FD6521A
MTMRVWRWCALTALTLLMPCSVATPAATAATRDVPTASAADIMPHLVALQEIADRHGGNRAHGTGGFAESLSYVRGVLDGAGFITQVVAFDHNGQPGYNLIADWPGGDESDVVFLGAHLDSVAQGPGLNDNGSGAAAILATAVEVANTDARPNRHLRFGWWGAEEEGLVGSANYVRGLDQSEVDNIGVYLNFDMVGTKTPQQWLLVDDGAPASDAFRKYFQDSGIPTFDVGVGGSDHVSFDARGIPVSGFSTGLDACYHESCDRIDNIDPASEETSTNAIIHTVWELAGA